MAIWSDMNGFPESGFPVLADVSDRICLGTLNLIPLAASGYIIDVVGAVRLGAVTISATGALACVGLAAGGAISGATTIAANNTVTLSSATAPLTMSGASAVMSMSGANAKFLMTGLNASIGTVLNRIRRGWFTDLDTYNVPTVQGDPVVLLSDLSRYVPCSGVQKDVNLGAKNLTTTGKLTGRMIPRTAASDPQDATPANRPAGDVSEIVFYSGKMYFCTDAATPTWEKITSS